MAKFTGNKDEGSLHVTNDVLPQQFRNNSLKPTDLFIQIEGEEKPRKVTYVMGSPAKGWNLCAKGTGKFPTDGEFELIVG